MKRVPNWGVAIREAAKGYIGSAFVWGETDCVTITRSLLNVMMGEDIISEHVKGKWSTETGAKRAYSSGPTFHETLTAIGFYVVPASVARDGDLMVVPGANYDNVSMRVGSKWINSSTKTGTVVAVSGEAPQNAKVYRI